MLQDALQRIVSLLDGTAQPQTPKETAYLEIMGVRGPRDFWPRQTRTCVVCDTAFEAVGFPSPTPKQWFYHKVCPRCRQKGERRAYAERSAPPGARPSPHQAHGSRRDSEPF